MARQVYSLGGLVLAAGSGAAVSALLLFALVVFVIHMKAKPLKRGGVSVMVTRSVANSPSGYATCGNCHGTWQAGLGLAEWGRCDGCGGNGSHKIDPNQKTYTLKELLEMKL